MGGLKRIAKQFGSIVLGDVRHVYDYVNDVCVPENAMPEGGARWQASEKVRWAAIQAAVDAERDEVSGI